MVWRVVVWVCCGVEVVDVDVVVPFVSLCSFGGGGGVV